jgi:hypothetical protein
MGQNTRWRTTSWVFTPGEVLVTEHEPIGVLTIPTSGTYPEIYVLTKEPFFDETTMSREDVPREIQVLKAQKGKKHERGKKKVKVED